MKAQRCELPYILLNEVNESNMIITCNPIDLDTKNGMIDTSKNHESSILDEKISVFGGAIPIPEGFQMFDPYAVASMSGVASIPINKNVFEYVGNKCPELLYTIPEGAYIPIPKHLNDYYTTEVGTDVLSIIQKRMDDMVYYYNQWAEELEINNMVWMQGYSRLLGAAANMLYKKSGLIDRAVGSLWPYSLRSVIVPDHTLSIDEVEIPKRVLKNWLNGRQVREAYGIDMKLSLDEAAACMNGRRILIGRNPSHDFSNLLSMKLRVI